MDSKTLTIWSPSTIQQSTVIGGMDEVPNKTSSMYIYNVHTTLLNVTKIYDLI